LILMAPFFILLYIQSPLQATLQALDLAKPAMWNSLIGAVFKFTVLIFLASQSQFGIKGVAIAMVTGVILVTLLHLKSLYKTIHFSIPIKDIVKMICLSIITWAIGLFFKKVYLSVQPNIFIF